MKVSGVIMGFRHRFGKPIGYRLVIGDFQVDVNDWLNHAVTLSFLRERFCVHCGRKVNKLFNNGSCYPCFKNLPENDLCIVKPQECHFHLGTCRDHSFAQGHCMVPHVVYLALSSEVKVGITRKDNRFKRWADQGAIQALPIAEVPTRKDAGELEFHLSQFLPDKTNWRKMLSGDVKAIDLRQVREEIQPLIPPSFRPFLLTEEEIVELVYPQLEQVKALNSWSLEKQDSYSGRLIGVKGNYLLFDSGVFHLKKHAGYRVEFVVEEKATAHNGSRDY